MKFARSLEENKIPEWKKSYIDYKGLKAKIAAIRSDERRRTLNLRNSLQAPLRIKFHRVTERHPPTNDEFAQSENSDSNWDKPPLGIQELSVKSSPSWNESAPVITTSYPVVDPYTDVLDISPPKSYPRSPLLPTLESLYVSLSVLETHFFAYLDAELEKVDSFYNKKEFSFHEKFWALRDQLRELNEHKRLFDAAHGSRNEKRNFQQAFDSLGLSGSQRSSNTVVTGRINMHPFDYHHGKQKLKKAFQEFYRGVELLNGYRELNFTGFQKALKKFDKVTRHQSQDVYLREKVRPCKFASGVILEDMMDQVEEIFAEKFEHGDRKKACQRLKSRFVRKSHYFSVFRSGIYLGIAVPVLFHGVYAGIHFLRAHDHSTPWAPLMEVYGGLFILIFFFLLIGINLLVWTRARINFPFIFEHNLQTAIDVRGYFELPAIMLMTLSCAFWLSFVNISSKHITPTTWPAIWIGFAFVTLASPLPVLSRTSRWWLFKNISKFFISGKNRVVFTQFWIADQLCSLSYSVANIYNIICAYSHEWVDIIDNCSANHWGVRIAIVAIPNFGRLVQCLRSFYDNKKGSHLINAGKYASSIMTFAAYYIWRSQGSPANFTMVFWCLCATWSSLYTSIWDIFMDWSLFQTRGGRIYLRKELLYTDNKFLYYFAAITNVVIRFIWVLHIPSATQDHRFREFLIAFLEMLRRIQWNFFRLENEQIGNTDLGEATRDVPLPYLSPQNGLDYEESDDDSSVILIQPEPEEKPKGFSYESPSIYNNGFPNIHSKETLTADMDELLQKTLGRMEKVWEKV